MANLHAYNTEISACFAKLAKVRSIFVSKYCSTSCHVLSWRRGGVAATGRHVVKKSYQQLATPF